MSLVKTVDIEVSSESHDDIPAAYNAVIAAPTVPTGSKVVTTLGMALSGFSAITSGYSTAAHRPTSPQMNVMGYFMILPTTNATLDSASVLHANVLCRVFWSVHQYASPRESVPTNIAPHHVSGLPSDRLNTT